MQPKYLEDKCGKYYNALQCLIEGGEGQGGEGWNKQRGMENSSKLNKQAGAI